MASQVGWDFFWTVAPFVFLFVFPLAFIGAAVFLIVHFSRKSRKLAAPAASSVAPATQIISRKCPQCGAELKPDVSEGLCPACLLQRGIATEGGAPPGTPPFVPPTIPDLARLFPQLEILELIGKGGMGAVYKARQPALDRFVALKILAPRSGSDLDFAERFTREARALAKLSHPNIVGVYDFGQIQRDTTTPSGSQPSTLNSQPLSYFIMEHVDGPNLRQVEQAGKLSPREALEIIPQICAALQFAHDEGIVHRDIKPENVLLDKKGRVKIADFGLAKILGQEPKDFRLTGARDVVGTPHYMAPEQIEKPQTVDHRADIYSLGVVFYEMLTGELPLGKFQPPSFCTRRMQIDVRLDEVVLHALEKAPERRYQQASQVKTAVETIAGSSNRTSGPAQSKPDQTPLAYAAMFFAGLSGIMGITVFGCFPHPPVALVWSILVAALAGVTLGIRARKTPTGKWAVMVGSINAAIWLAVALAVHRTSFQISAGWQPRIELHATNAPAASAETWAPALAPGEKPDLQKILDEAKNLMSQGRYEESLQRHLWHFNHASEFGDSYQSVVRLTSGLSDWEELGRRYPKAKQALIELRDTRTREIAGGGGYSEMFREVQAINHELQDDDATWALFKTIYEQDPKLAHQSYFYAEDLLVSKGDYELCLACIGNPQARFKFYLDSLERQRESQQRMDEMRKQFPTPGYVPPDRGRMATNNFVGDVRKLVEILVGAGRQTEAEKIQVQASSVLDDARLKSAVSDAVEKVQKIKTSPRPASARTVVRPPAVMPSRPAKTNSTGPAASAELWSPAIAPGGKPDSSGQTPGSGVINPATGLPVGQSSIGFDPASGLPAGDAAWLSRILDEARELTAKHQYEEALQRHIWYHNHVKEFGNSYQNALRLTSALSDWEELGRRYPKAKQALMEIRDKQTREFAEGRGYSELFQEVQAINDELQDDGATLALFKTIYPQDKQLAGQCYGYAENLLMQNGDYDWCLKCIGDPQAHFESCRRNLESQRESQQRMEAMRKQFPGPVPRSPGGAFKLPDMGQMATNNFVGQIRTLVEILVATGHQAAAEKIQAQAVSVLDDARLRSAVSDAELKIQKRNTVQTLAEQPPVVVETQPLSGACDVPPGETEIRVRFSKEMTDGSWSWSTAWENSAPEIIGQPHYESDGRTCVAKVKLEPGRTYAWWLNSNQFKNFTDLAGRPAVPYLLIFQTKPNKTEN